MLKREVRARSMEDAARDSVHGSEIVKSDVEEEDKRVVVVYFLCGKIRTCNTWFHTSR